MGWNLPSVNAGDFQRSMSMSLPTSPNRLESIDNPDPSVNAGPSGPGSVNPQPPQVVQPDPAINEVVRNGVGPDLQPGNGQGAHFAANHEVGPGRDWDLNSAEGMLDTAQKAVANIKTTIAGRQGLDDFDKAVTDTVARTVAAHPENVGAVEALATALTEFKTLIREVQSARAALTAAVKDGSGVKDPREALAGILKTLRVFRYDMQVQLARYGHEAGRMDVYESALREIQHAFTFKVGSKVGEDFPKLARLEHRLADKFAEIRDKLRAMDPAVRPTMPKGIWIGDVAGKALELSHLTNDRIRDFQDADGATCVLREIVGPIAEKGGSRKVEFNVGVGALIGLGFSSAFTAGVRAGARFRVVGEISCGGPGREIKATFRIAGGLEAKGGIQAGKDSEFLPGAGAKAEGSAGAEVSHFTTRSYQTLDDFLLDASRNKLATSRTVGGAIWGGIKSVGRAIGSLGTKFFRWLGRKGGEVKQTVGQYLQTLKARGVAGALDRLLSGRANPVIVAERKGWTLRGQAQAKVGANFSGLVDVSLQGNASAERDFKVRSLAFTSVARAAVAAKDDAALHALMRPDPATGARSPVEEFVASTPEGAYNALEEQFERAIDEAKEVEKRSSGAFRFTDKAGFSRVANRIRSLLLATELAARRGSLPREAADRLLARYANPSVKFPPDIFRTYFMEGAGASKPAKIRVTASAKLKIGLFKDWSDGLTDGITNGIGKAVADGAVNAMRKEVGLDTTVQYQYSSEKPANPGEDPRPWENVKRTKHELLVSASAPARIVIDAITRTYINKGERIENQSENIAKDIAKDTAKDIGKDTAKTAMMSVLPGLVLASVKETAIAGVKKWLSDPENVAKLVEFAIEHAADAFNFVLGAVEWVVNHPEATLQIAASIQGTSSTGEAERYKKIAWSYVDGEFESLTVSSETQNKIGVNVDPVGVGLGVGFDLSYSVTENVKERDITPRPTLTMLLAKGEEFLFGETGLAPAGTGEAFKNWLSRNAMGVRHMVTNLMSEANRLKTLDLYAKALVASSADSVLQQRLQEAWRGVQALPADATLDAQVAAAHKLISAMVLAFRAPAA